MKPSNRMQSLIEKLAKARNIDLEQSGAHFKAQSPGFMDLVVENIGRNRVSVTHYYSQNGDLCQDPEIVFWTCPIDGKWYAIEWTTPPIYLFGRTAGGWQKVLWLNSDATMWEKGSPKAQADLATFANKWSTNLRRQGFA